MKGETEQGIFGHVPAAQGVVGFLSGGLAFYIGVKSKGNIVNLAFFLLGRRKEAVFGRSFRTGSFFHPDARPVAGAAFKFLLLIGPTLGPQAEKGSRYPFAVKQLEGLFGVHFIA